MKKIFFSILSLVLTHGVFAQMNKQQIADIDKARQEIKSHIADLNKIEKSKKENGYRNIYTKDKELILTTVYFKDQNINKNVEWYFSKGQLIYSEQIWKDDKTEKIIDNQKSYLVNGQLMAWIKMDSIVNNNSQEFKDLGTQLVAYALKLKEDAK